ENKRGSFSGKLGFVLSAAGASVGLGNIWRFPYLCASYGGGIFLIIYLVLAHTFGYTMIMAETSIGRMSKKSPVGAYSYFSDKKIVKAGGWINAIIPLLIVPYYSVIGGWVIRYLVEYIVNGTEKVTDEAFFGNFISSNSQPEIYFIIFALMTMVVIFIGVENGIEKVSKFMMPILVVLAVIISIYSVTRPGAIEGVKYMFIPNFKNFSFMTVVTAMGQMFYSLSIAMGILITFGSYMKRDVSIEGTTNQVVFFDSLIAIMAALMIIPSVFAFSSSQETTLNAGPSLMFITMPNIFNSMGIGRIIAVLFFSLVLMAALTSSIALAESAVATIDDQLKFGRKKSTVIVGVIIIVLGSLSALGYGALGNVKIIGMQFLDFFDFLTNSVMMPIAAFASCLLVTVVIKRAKVAEEICSEGNQFKGKPLFNFMIKYVCPLFVIVILISSVANAFGWIKM
nr:sodium-dependent transporter [Lachnospiraceae bacterium]